MEHTTRRVTYRGNPALVSMLVQMLEQEGATVEWEPPQKQHGGIGGMAQNVIVDIVATGSILGFKTAIDKFRKHVHGGGAATIEDDDSEPSDS